MPICTQSPSHTHLHTRTQATHLCDVSSPLIDTHKYLYTQNITQSHAQVTIDAHSLLLLTHVSIYSDTVIPTHVISGDTT